MITIFQTLRRKLASWLVGGTRMGTQAAIAVSAIFIVSVIALGLASFHALQDQLNLVISDEQNLIVSQIADTVSQRIATVRNVLKKSAADIRPEELASAESAQSFLNSNHGLASIFDRSVFVFSADGNLLAERPYRADRIGQNGRWRSYISETLDSRKPVISEPFTTNSGDKNIVVVLTMPVLSAEGKLLGMISGSLGLTRPEVLGSFNKIVIGQTGSISITTADGKVITGKDKELLSQPLYPLGSDALFSKALKGFEGTDEGFTDDGRLAYVTYKKVAETGWIVRGIYPKDEANALVKQQFKKLLWSLFGITALIPVIVLVISRYLTNPLTRLSQHITAYSGSEGLIKPLECEQGALEVRSLTAAFNNMTHRLNTREELVVNTMRQHQIITENSTDLITKLSPTGLVLYASPSVEQVLGISPQALEGKNILDFVHAEDRALLAISLTEATKIDHSSTISYRALSATDHYVWLESAQRRLMDRHDQCEILSISRNIESHKRMQEELFRQARVDHLTKLPNRLALEESMDELLSRAYRAGTSLAVLAIDIDRFKNINDTLGHRRGDEIIVMVSQRFLTNTRPHDTVARMGGDEFVILLPDIKSGEQAKDVALRYMEALKGSIQIDGGVFHLTTSIGVSFTADGSVTPETLLANADVAMYRAKSRGGNACVVFTPEMNTGAHDRLSMESALFHAIERNELVLHYQPLISVKSGKITGVEALVRWKHPELGMVFPGDFILMAERVGLIEEIGQWVLKTACKQMTAWHAQGLSGWKVSVNLSARQFTSEHLCEMVKNALAEAKLDPQYLELELTETALMEDPVRSQKMLSELKACGVFIALDDFGIGYSSMNYLMTFTLDTLKIDRAFTKDVLISEKSRAIVQATFDIARALNLKTVAEGVEEYLQASFLADLNCDSLQGYFFAKPMPADEVYQYAQTSAVHLFPRRSVGLGLAQPEKTS